jgi:RIO-like serine/threonine protein kinase
MDFPPPYSHYHDIIRKLTSLHQENYVHGDIRNTNIMMKKDGNQGFKLVDFDWYPMNVYRG